MKDGLTWIELSKDNFSHNLKTIRGLIGPKVILAPCIKANAYGHGLIESAKILSENGADWLCVDTVDEGLILRENSISCPILILGYIHPDEIGKVVDNKFRVFVYDENLAKFLSKEALEKKVVAYVHLKVDTGMSRQGIRVEDLENFLSAIQLLPNLTIEGLATHFATSDEISDRAYYAGQIEKFDMAISICKNKLGNSLIIHGANSGAVLTDPKSYYDLVRPGIAVYGYYPSDEVKASCQKKNIKLLPVLSLYTKIVQVKHIKKGEGISYGCTYIASKEMKVAVLCIGYYDGIARVLGNIGFVLIHGEKARIVGRVCMNMIIIDVTDILLARSGDYAVIIGRDGKNEITADTIASLSGTVNYEVITRLRESTKRIIK